MLYERLQKRDYFVLADLLKWDIEFLTDRRAIVTILGLKHSPDLPDKQCRAELRRIANVIRRRPSRSRRKLPYGDQLEAELGSLTRVIEERRLLEVKTDRKAIQERLAEVMRKPMPKTRDDGKSGALVSDLSKEQLLELKDDGQRRRGRRKDTTRKPTPEPPREETEKLASTMARVAGVTTFRRARSWALHTMADYYGTERKLILQAIKREQCAGLRRR